MEARTCDCLSGTLLGTAIGDALGLPAEGMSAPQIQRRWGKVDRFRLCGPTGFVSDDTEQAALVAEALARHPDDPDLCAAAFRKALVAWFFRLPFGVGLATIKASLRAAAGLRPSGVASAGNGAAMRAAVLGVHFQDDPEARLRFGRALAAVTHTDPRAIEGALFVAELAALCASGAGRPREERVRDAARVVSNKLLAPALQRALSLAAAEAAVPEAAAELGTSGYVVHTTAFAAYCFMRFGDRPLEALTLAIGAGGDTDSVAAILGGWLGALHGEAALPADLVDSLHDGPFGPTHLRALARSLAEGAPPSRYSAAAALARNLALFPVILAHGFRRLLPP